jgi:hypothetical protein
VLTDIAKLLMALGRSTKKLLAIQKLTEKILKMLVILLVGILKDHIGF